ncbi:MAG: aldehyde dehydrogenase family protein [Candidatus Micrarchaeota archaeon]|nr:aldehyde dehydrogenase family protein [Candidatus Micrarchaeota archaeon]MDE1847521.1 aldehyde dehydrogenase family protein [Candidatus Micrarchaeota archaeon]MDE1863843.1 aldehyde dehydrogenase family protein [Candidatus Micrarchaeota archaeon]
MAIRSINPATGEFNKEIEELTDSQALEVCKAAKIASKKWHEIGLEERLLHVKRLGEVLRERKGEYARLATLEMGRLLVDAEREIGRCADLCDLYVRSAKVWLEDELVETEFKKSVVSFDPIGVVLAVMPWNFPYSQVFRCTVPAMVVGNAVVLRHSNSVPICALAIEDAFKKAGFPENTFRTIITQRTAVAKLVRSKFVDGVSFTGSTSAGREIAQIAARNIKKCVLELGGSNPFIVLDDADIELAATQAVETRIPSCGQSCSASKRFIVVKAVAEEFKRRVVEKTNALVIGDPSDKNTRIGPVANLNQLKSLEEQVGDARKKGARIECGGERYGKTGFFYRPTVITAVKRNMKVMKEEVFGPVIPIIQVKNGEEAIRLANDTEFGLGGSVWTTDTVKGERLARRIDAGVVCVNRGASSDNRMPFGGTKRSGIGREFSRYGLLEFANIRSVVIA